MKDIVKERKSFGEFLNSQIRSGLSKEREKTIDSRGDSKFSKDMNVLAGAFNVLFTNDNGDESKRDIWKLVVDMLIDTINMGLQNGECDINSVMLIEDTTVLRILQDKGMEISSDSDVYDELINFARNCNGVEKEDGEQIGKVRKR